MCGEPKREPRVSLPPALASLAIPDLDAIYATGDVYVWGWNYWSQLGVGEDKTDKADPFLLSW